MNRALAIQILELGASPTAADAKAAFRKLVKACHPDRFARDPGKAKAAEERMKQINQAFSYLYPLLPGERPIQTGVRQKKTGAPPSSEKGPGWFHRLKNQFRPRRPAGQGGPNPAGAKTAAGPGTATAGTRPKPQSRQPRPVSFERVLQETGHATPQQAPRVSKPPGIRPGSPYARYVRLKQQMQRQKNRSADTGISRVEKISPVERVKPVHRD